MSCPDDVRGVACDVSPPRGASPYRVLIGSRWRRLPAGSRELYANYAWTVIPAALLTPLRVGDVVRPNGAGEYVAANRGEVLARGETLGKALAALVASRRPS